SKWITDLKNNTMKLIEDNIQEYLDDLGFGDDFLDMTPKTQSLKERINNLDFIKIKIFCSMKDNVNRKRQATDLKKKYLQKTHDKGLSSKTHKEFLKLNNKKTTQFKKWVKGLNRHLTKDDIQMAKKYMKR
ncbi:LORF2 protein, partial [Crocuta crocuta]